MYFCMFSSHSRVIKFSYRPPLTTIVSKCRHWQPPATRTEFSAGDDRSCTGWESESSPVTPGATQLESGLHAKPHRAVPFSVATDLLRQVYCDIFVASGRLQQFPGNGSVATLPEQLLHNYSCTTPAQLLLNNSFAENSHSRPGWRPIRYCNPTCLSQLRM